MIVIVVVVVAFVCVPFTFAGNTFSEIEEIGGCVASRAANR